LLIVGVTPRNPHRPGRAQLSYHSFTASGSSAISFPYLQACSIPACFVSLRSTIPVSRLFCSCYRIFPVPPSSTFKAPVKPLFFPEEVSLFRRSHEVISKGFSYFLL
jgi:hypothetical protein